LVVIEELLAAGATITAHAPEAMEFCRQHHLGDRITYASNPMSAIDGADALVLVTEWNEFRRPDFEAIQKGLKQPIIFDGRNVWPKETLVEMGFKYHGVGR